MKALLILPVALVAALSHAEEQRIYQQDAMGRTLYDRPSYFLQPNGRIVESDTLGNKQYHKQQYQIKGDKIYPVSAFGAIQHDKPSWVIKASPSTKK